VSRRRTIDIVVSNAYAANRRRKRYRRRLRRTRAAVLVVTESSWVGRLRGYRRHGAPGGVHARDCAIYVRRGIRVDHTAARTLTRDVGGYAHARTVVEVRLRYRGQRWAVFAVHANPGRKGRAAEQNARLLRGVRAQMEAARRDGYEPAALGDWNRRATETGPDTPATLARRLGGVCRLVNIDGVVTTARVLWLRSRGRPPGADHPLIRTRLSAREVKR